MDWELLFALFALLFSVSTYLLLKAPTADSYWDCLHTCASLDKPEDMCEFVCRQMGLRP